MTAGPWVILLTDRRRLGAPVKLVSHVEEGCPTEKAGDALRFETLTEARGWWRNTGHTFYLDAHYVPTFVPASELSPTGKAPP